MTVGGQKADQAVEAHAVAQPGQQIGQRIGATAAPPGQLRWRRRVLSVVRALGPERLAPEWWLDDPAWRSGMRDYWRLDCAEGPRLWAFFTPQAPGWAVQGVFA